METAEALKQALASTTRSGVGRAYPVELRERATAIVRVTMAREILEGDVFVFVGRRRRTAKCLWWDDTGFSVLAKRMSKGRFFAPW